MYINFDINFDKRQFVSKFSEKYYYFIVVQISWDRCVILINDSLCLSLDNYAPLH